MNTQQIPTAPSPSIMAAIDQLKRSEPSKPNGVDLDPPFTTSPSHARKAARWKRQRVTVALMAVPVSIGWSRHEAARATGVVEWAILLLGHWTLAIAGLGLMTIAGHIAVGLFKRITK